MEQSIVVLRADLIAELAIKTSEPTRSFTIFREKFFVYDQPDQNLVNLAKTEILTGQSAAVLHTKFLKPSAVFFDMDATVIAEESLVEIAKAANKSIEIEKITQMAMAGNLDFKESLAKRLSILKCLPRSVITSIKPTLNPGMEKLAQWLTTQGIPMFLISGGFIDLAKPIAEKLNFKDYKANEFAWDGDIMSGTTRGDIIDGAGKCMAVKEWCQKLSFDPKNCLAVGDGANDLPMMNFCGLAIGYSPKKILWDQIDIANHTGSHEFLHRIINFKI